MARPFTFNDVLAHIGELTGGKPNRSPHNLEITTRLAKAMGLNLNPAPSIHIAGTKGKGTTSYLCAELLRASGLRVGLFTSPHLVDVRERFLVDGQLIPKARFAEYWGETKRRQLEVLNNAASQLDRESASRSNYFRFLFLMSLIAFEAERVDAVVYEVGVGGRIDSTNVITPRVCGITSLGMDHMDVLGPTINHIALEKAGIMKKNVPCYAQLQLDFPDTEDVLRRHAREVETPLAFVDEDIVPTRKWPPLAMGGEHMKRNAALALALSRTFQTKLPYAPLEPHEERVLATAQYPGRSQIVPIPRLNLRLFIDGAHTPESIRAGVEWFRGAASVPSDVPPSERGTRNVLVMFTTRDPQKLLEPFEHLGRSLDKVIFVPPKESRGGVDSAMEAVANLALTWEASRSASVPMDARASPFASLEELADAARHDPATGKEDSRPLNVLVTGSLFVVGEALELVIKHLTPPAPKL